jgi:enamine deaminase RidA (YjgF/YER057c/UK114 family)
VPSVTTVYVSGALPAGYSQFFGTKEQPNKPARSAVQVAALVAPGALLEIEVIAAKRR